MNKPIIIHAARPPCAEVISHICRTCGQPYTDNCRTSKDCDSCKPIVKAARNHKRNAKRKKVQK
jgi:hypothetical protein